MSRRRLALGREREAIRASGSWHGGVACEVEDGAVGAVDRRDNVVIEVIASAFDDMASFVYARPSVKKHERWYL